jgi:hypothetical protein
MVTDEIPMKFSEELGQFHRNYKSNIAHEQVGGWVPRQPQNPSFEHYVTHWFSICPLTQKLDFHIPAPVD